jgi:histidine kinase
LLGLLALPEEFMNTIRQHLGWKLFLSYLVIIVVGIVSLSIAAQIHAPTALDRHMAIMLQPAGDMTDMMSDVTIQFTRAINEVLLVATTTAVIAAIAISSFVTRRIVAPIQQMRQVSQRIAAGSFDERIPVISNDELGDLAKSFNQMALQLAQTEERRRQLIGDVAHELRTPLTSIRSVMEGVIDGVLPNSASTFLEVQNEVRRLQRLVGDLEQLSKAEAGQLLLECESIPPIQFIQLAIDRLTWQFEEKQVALEIDVSSELPRIVVDTHRMTQVMLNLLGNALQYTGSGGRVRVSAIINQSTLLIDVTDTGIGFTVEQSRHIFERFYRVDKSRSRSGGGSGIGLTISQHIVEAHGGTLSASSPGLDQGSTFTVVLSQAKA